MSKTTIAWVTAVIILLCSQWSFAQSMGPLSGVMADGRIGLAPPSFNIAWTDGWTNLAVDFTELWYPWSRGQLAGGPNFKRMAFKYPTSGVLLSLVVPIRVNEAIGFRAEADVLIPGTNRKAEQFVDQDASNPGFPYAYALSISTRSTWCVLDGRAEYAPAGFGKIIGGLKWDYLDTRVYDFPLLSLLSNPPLGPLVQVSAPGMQGDLTYNILLPYVGLDVSYGGPYSSVTARALGFPWIKTWLDGRETQGGYSALTGNVADRYEMTMGSKRGYFWELVAEYKSRWLSNTEMGLFAKWSQIHARFDGEVLLKTFRVVPAPFAPDLGASFPAPDVTLQRNIFTAGATFLLAFNFPY